MQLRYRFPIRRRPVSLVTLLIAAAALLLAACTPDNPQSTFGVGGPVSRQQADLFIFVFWIAVVVFILVEGLIVYFAFRFRRRSDAEMPAQTHGNTKLEITWTLIPAVIIIAIAIPTVKGIWDLSAPPDGVNVQVEAVGHQWWFEFRYPSEEIVTANELRVPVGVPVVVELRSQDVIHSFWIPKLAGKVDMVPLKENQLWFQADEPGVYYGQCAEFCGFVHALMRFRVVAMPQDEYDAWVSSWHSAAPPPAAGTSAAAGQGLFLANCAMCHTANSFQDNGYLQELDIQDQRWAAWESDIENSALVSAPNLTHFGTRATFVAGTEDLTRENLIAWIKDPSSLKPDTRMQKHAVVYDTADGTANLSDEQIGNIADYLMSLAPGEGDGSVDGGTTGTPEERGQALFSSNGCSGCHSTGSNTLVGPGLAGVLDRAGSRVPGLSAEQYITQSVREPNAYVVEGFTSPTLMPPFSGLSDQQIADLIAFLGTLE